MYPKHCLYHPFARVYLSMYANLYDHRFFKRAKMPKLNWNSYFEGQSKRPLFATNRTPLQTLTGISTDLTSLVWVFVLSLKKKKQFHELFHLSTHGAQWAESMRRCCFRPPQISHIPFISDWEVDFLECLGSWLFGALHLYTQALQFDDVMLRSPLVAALCKYQV